MKTIAEIRLDNLEGLVKENKTLEKVAELAASSSVYLSQVRNKTPDNKTGKPRQIGDPMARRLEEGCKKEVGWMDNIHPATGNESQQKNALPVAADISHSAWKPKEWPFDHITPRQWWRELKPRHRRKAEGLVLTYIEDHLPSASQTTTG